MGVSDHSPAFTLINGIKWAYLKRGQGRNILCREDTYDLFQGIAKAANTNYHSLYLHRQITGLSANTGSISNLLSKYTVLKRKLQLEGGAIHYEMRGGDILLTKLVVDSNYRNNTQDAMGLYDVFKDDGTYSIKPVTTVENHHVAINGAVKDINKAANLMPNFINHGYPSDKLSNIGKYTLFYNPYNGTTESDWKCLQDSTGIRGGSQAARQLAAAIEIAAKDKQKINWTVHERGCAIFKQALRLASKSPQYDYSQQTVFYANPVVNMELLDQQRKRLGMQLSEKGFIMNELSLHQGVVAGNWISEAAMLWQMGNKGGAVSKTAGRIGKIGGAATAPMVLPGMIGAAPWVIGMVTILGANLVSRYSNQGIIENDGDALNHYLFKRK